MPDQPVVLCAVIFFGTRRLKLEGDAFPDEEDRVSVSAVQLFPWTCRVPISTPLF